MYKIYLSPALHAHDNPTKCPTACGENVHCNQYMDIVERRLLELGFAVKRGDKAMTGAPAMKARAAEANKWGADLYYVAHTNAGGGRYAKTFCWKDSKSVATCKIFGKYKSAVEKATGAKWRWATNTELYEIRTPKAITLYDELFFHDNAADCKWFHTGGMEQCAEETVRGICDIFGVEYKTPQNSPEKPRAIKAGDKLELKDHPIYRSSTAKEMAHTVTGVYWVYDGKKVNGRYRITNKAERVGALPVGNNVTGWVKL